ncbi:MAG TPA: response regulator [Chitinophagales bacterium]|nr:response regulator [Chitinophagales bacterium]
MSRYILMLEHDAHDREIAQSYFANNQPTIHVEFVTYSNELIARLDKSTHLPGLILLAINTVPANGLEVVKQLKANDHYKHIPVVVLGESTLPDWVKKCYAAGANSVINKPSTLQLTNKKIDTFITYWFEVAELSHDTTKPAAQLN